MTRKDAATAAGLSERQRKTALRLANLSEAEFDAAIECDKPATVTALVRLGIKHRAEDLKSGIQAALAGFSGENEWYTPAEWIELARDVMGRIDCDPATTELAQRTVNATVWYSRNATDYRKNGGAISGSTRLIIRVG